MRGDFVLLAAFFRGAAETNPCRSASSSRRASPAWRRCAQSCKPSHRSTRGRASRSGLRYRCSRTERACLRTTARQSSRPSQYASERAPRGRVRLQDMSCHEPIERHSHRGKILLYRRLRFYGPCKFAIGREMNRLDRVELVDTMLLELGDTSDDGTAVRLARVLVGDRRGEEFEEALYGRIAGGRNHSRRSMLEISRQRLWRPVNDYFTHPLCAPDCAHRWQACVHVVVPRCRG